MTKVGDHPHFNQRNLNFMCPHEGVGYHARGHKIQVSKHLEFIYYPPGVGWLGYTVWGVNDLDLTYQII